MPTGDPRDWGDWSYGPFDTFEEERRAKHTHLGGPDCECCKKNIYEPLQKQQEELFKKIAEMMEAKKEKETKDWLREEELWFYEGGK